jgi:hypothetical protein
VLFEFDYCSQIHRSAFQSNIDQPQHHLSRIVRQRDTMLAQSIGFVALAAVGVVNAQGSLQSWHPAGPGDCMYTFANFAGSSHK